MDSNEKSSDFFELWKEFEKYINDNADYGDTFKSRLDSISKKNHTIKNNKDEICQLYAIRNLIAHENSRKFYAYPNEYTLKKLKKLLEGIKTPIYVNNIIKNTPITFDVKQSILEVINAIKKYKISQFPVYKDKILLVLFQRIQFLFGCQIL